MQIAAKPNQNHQDLKALIFIDTSTSILINTLKPLNQSFPDYIQFRLCGQKSGAKLTWKMYRE